MNVVTNPIVTMKSDLSKVIGKVVSEDFSSTGRAKLLSVGNKYVRFEMMKSPYGFDGIEDEGRIYTRPILSAWKTFFR